MAARLAAHARCPACDDTCPPSRADDCVDFQDASRWSYGVELGWAQSLNRRELRVVSGTPTDTDWNEVRWLAAGGPVVAGSIGYAF